MRFTEYNQLLGIHDMDDRLDYTIEFINKDFDLESELPIEHNAGNSCYGSDVAEYIVKQLKPHCEAIEYIDEDWGWQVFGNSDAESKFDINIYPWGFIEDKAGDEFYLWRLRVCAKKKGKLLGFIPVYKPTKCTDSFCETLKGIFSSEGFRFVRMEIGVEW